MQIYRGFEAIKFHRPRVATVGSFDGVHRGHDALLQRVRQEAEAQGLESMVVTFSPHPRLVLEEQCDLAILTTLQEKIYLLDRMGIDSLLIIPFDRDFSRLSPREFIRMLIERADVKSLVVGYDHRFGCDKSGNFDLLKSMGINAVEVEEKQVENCHVSSTVIRRVVESGQMKQAEQLLGYPYLLFGEVAPDGRITPEEPSKLIPSPGLYPVELAGEPATLEITPQRELSLKCSLPVGAGEKMIRFL